MKRVVSLAVTCFLVLAAGSVALAADPFCEQINRILAGAGDKFSTLKAEAAKEGVEMWAAKEMIRGAEECFIVGENPSYMCSLYAGDKDEDARATYQDHVEWIGKCLGNEWKGRETADAEITRHTFSRGSSDPTVRIQSEIGDANAHTVEIWIDPPNR